MRRIVNKRHEVQFYLHQWLKAGETIVFKPNTGQIFCHSVGLKAGDYPVEDLIEEVKLWESYGLSVCWREH